MDNLLLQITTMFMGFFAIMNPLANTPVFISLTSDDDEQTTRRIARRAVILAFIIVAVFALAGKLIFSLFGLNMDAFRITGGLLVFLIGFHMLQGQHSHVQHPHSLDRQDEQEDDPVIGIATFPLAMPVLAGPGTLTTAMSLSARGGLTDISLTIATFALLCLITYFVFVSGERFVRYIGHDALGVITRLMGLIVAVMGTGMVIEGARGAFSLG
ncbi:MAG: MarC family protein [Pseudomonadota bacterium]|nr:MarC family protein [Pseudomonadota bacterium]